MPPGFWPARRLALLVQRTTPTTMAKIARNEKRMTVIMVGLLDGSGGLGVPYLC